MIIFNCPKCEKEFKSKDEYAGRKFACTECGQECRIPALQELQKPSAIAMAVPVPTKSAPTPPPPLPPKRPVKTVEEQWSIVSGTHSQFLAAQQHRKTVADSVNITGHVDKDLEGVKDKLKKALADGLLKGMHPRDIARSIIKNVAGVGKKRAMSIARTESIRALAQGQLDSMERLGVKQLAVMVEWGTADDDRVCPLCQPLHGVVLTIDEAKGMIPRHESCRCCFIPANVGEDTTDQIRTAAKIRKAIEKSIMAEIPEGSNRTLAEQKELSTWVGAKREISSVRPKSLVSPRRK